MLKLVRYPDKRLKTRSSEMSGVTDNTRAFLSNLSKLMMKEGHVIAAASHVGLMKRMGVIYDERFGLVALINPIITEQSGAVMVPTTCLHFAGKATVVYRPEKVKVKYQTIENNEVELEFDGQAAACISQLVDVLDGVTIKDRNKQAQRILKESKLKEQENKNEVRTEEKTDGAGASEPVFTGFAESNPYTHVTANTETES